MFKGLFGGRSGRHYARGIAQFNEGHLTEAIAFFEEAIEHDGDGPDAALARFYRAEAHARLGAQALERKQPREALAHFDAALADHARFPDLHIQRAIALLQLDDPLAAERSARTALELNPQFIDAGAVVVVALMAQGDARRADEAASRWAKIAAGRGDALAAAFTDPAGLFKALVAARGRRAERRRLVERAEACLRDGFWADAAQTLEPMVTETPDYPDLRLRLAAARLGQGDLGAAQTQLDEALRLNPEFGDAHVLAGNVALRGDRVRSAREHFAAAAASGRAALAAVYGTMLCDLRTGDFRAALDGMNRLVAEDAPPEEARVLHALLESVAGRAGTAAERLEAALVDTRATALLLDLVAWGVEASDFDFARRALEKIDEAERTRADVVRMNARLAGAEGALDRARQLCESALLDHPRNAGLLLELARTLGRQGEAGQALRCLEQVDQPVGAAEKAALLRQAGDLDGAREVLDDRGLDGAAALELLYICRAVDDDRRAQEIWATGAATGLASVAWRIQDPVRWLGPLRPWPAGVAAPRPAA